MNNEALKNGLKNEWWKIVIVAVTIGGLIFSMGSFARSVEDLKVAFDREHNERIAKVEKIEAEIVEGKLKDEQLEGDLKVIKEQLKNIDTNIAKILARMEK